MSLTPPVLWLIAGVILCVMEFVLPTAFVELTMGISAIVVGLMATLIPYLGLQVVVWLILSIILTILMRRLMPSGKARVIEDAREAETLTEILPGQTGRVLYEGNSWQARCDISDVAIAPHQKVHVVGRQGTTLLVMPDNLFLHQ